MKFSVFQISRKGGREKNEDRMGYCYTREAGLFLLADGMGGHAEGEVAAQIALQTIAAQFQREATPLLDDVTGFLTSALLQAHRQILRYAQSKHMADTPRSWAFCNHTILERRCMVSEDLSADPRFADALRGWCAEERAAVASQQQALRRHAPFRTEAA